MKNFLLVSNKIKDIDLMLANEVLGVIKNVSDEICISVIDMSELKNCADNLEKKVECILVLGGDGTLLKVAKDASELDIPVVGINYGSVGYLTEIEISDVENAIKSLLNDEYCIEERMMLDGQVQFRNKTVSSTYSALNDVVISRSNNIQVVGYRVYVNDQQLIDYYADGIIISTSTGSTGYNLSVGGPIASPDSKLMIMSPVCPHTLISRSIILSPDDRIAVKILPPKGDKPVAACAYFDGRDDIEMFEGDSIEITKSEKITKICKISKVGFLKNLKSKLN